MLCLSVEGNDEIQALANESLKTLSSEKISVDKVKKGGKRK